MTTKKRSAWRSSARALARVALLPLLTAGIAGAQTAPQATTADDPNVLKLEKFEVTGSYIPVAGTATAIPVTTIDAQAISATGVSSNVLEVLRKASPQFSGNGNLGNTNANISSGGTGGGSQVAFRNTQTLVLINGRRSAYAPILASGGSQFVDVNLFPISAIEKIEVLQDGASAIYGTDAVSGVVNIILKSDYKGAEIGARYGFSDNKGNYAERKAWVVVGASNDTTSVTASAEWTKSDPLFQYEREFAAEAYGTGTFAGVVSDASGNFYVLNPSLNAPPATGLDLTPAQLIANGTYIQVNGANLISGLGAEKQYAFNLAQYVTLLLRNERQSATVSFDHRASDKLSVFGDLLYSSTKTYSQLNAQPTSASMAASDPRNPFNINVTARNRFLDHPRQYFYNTNNVRGVIGAKGSFSDDWKWEVGALNNKIEQNYENPGVIDTAARVAAVSGGVLNYFARNQAAGAVDASGMFGTALGKATAVLESYDGRVSGKLMDLPAGEVGVAFGAEKRVEKLNQTADRNSQSNTFSWDSATTLDPFSANRDVKGYFANVRVPVLGDSSGKGMLLEVEGAVRYEKYSDTDDPTVPKYSIRYLPFNDQFAVRGTYSESFAAPTLFQLFGPGGIGFTSALSLQRNGGGAAITGQANARSGANPGLKPATSENYTFGFVWSPKSIKGFSISLDYFNIEQSDLISTIGSATILQDVELKGTASPYASFVRLGTAPSLGLAGFTSGAPITAAGQIGNRAIDTIYVTDTLVNIAKQKLAGLDIKANYTWNTDSLGRFDASFAGVWWNYYKGQTLPGTAEFDTVGLATNFNGTIPEYQTYTTVRWSRGSWAANLGWQFIPSVKDENWYDDTDTGADEKVEAFHSIDLWGAYTFGSDVKWLNGLTVRVGANNVFNESPPMAKGTFTESNADIATYGAIGRLFFIEAKYKF
jgi:iron complex outermembrane receptor protein